MEVINIWLSEILLEPSQWILCVDTFWRYFLCSIWDNLHINSHIEVLCIWLVSRYGCYWQRRATWVLVEQILQALPRQYHWKNILTLLGMVYNVFHRWANFLLPPEFRLFNHHFSRLNWENRWFISCYLYRYYNHGSGISWYFVDWFEALIDMDDDVVCDIISTVFSINNIFEWQRCKEWNIPINV